MHEFYILNSMSDKNEFCVGDLVMLVSEFGHVIPEVGCVLVLEKSTGYPADMGETRYPELIYTILMAGEVEKKVSGSWLTVCTSNSDILKIKE